MPKLKELLIFDHDTGIVSLKYNRVSDLFVSPNYDNLRHIGKVIRYYALHHEHDIKCRRIFGKNYLKIKESGRRKTYCLTKKENQKVDNIDFTVGIIVYGVLSLVFLALVTVFFKPIMYLLIILILLSFAKGK